MKSITQVMQNLVKPYIDNKDKAYAANIAPVEVSPAEATHTAGTQLIYNGVLYDVTADIAINDDLATEGAGANISAADKVTEQISSQNEALTNEVEARAELGAHNLLPNNATTQVINGVTFTVNADKSITVSTGSGGATANTQFTLSDFSLEKGSYILSGLSTTVQTISLFLTSGITAEVNFSHETASFTLAEKKSATAKIFVGSGTVLTDAVTFYPMIRLATDTDTTYQPYSKTNQQLTAENEILTNQITAIENDIDDIMHRVDVCYGFQINGSESNPSSAVTYIADAVGFTPAAMNYTTGKFNYGSWEDAFFMPRPCMLKSDGTVDYYLDTDDYSKKEDGTASDIANTDYDGNAMMEWGRNGRKIWLKIQPSSDGHSAKVWIANNQVDSKFHDYSFHNCKGESAEHFYTPIYNGSVISSKMRSLSGQTVSKSLQGTAEITAAKANNPSTDELWNIECFADRVLINMLLILMGKSLDTQTVFGQGANSGGSEAVNDTFTTGVHNTKGLFYGTNSGAVSANTFGNCVKVFGMENYYGFRWRRTNGLILNNGATKYKLTYGTEDGSTATGYNTDGTNYKDASVTPSGTNGNYISAAKFTEDGMFSDTMSGSASTYYCDATWFNNGAVTFAIFGGHSSRGATVGAFVLALDATVSDAGWILGASVSCKPLA